MLLPGLTLLRNPSPSTTSVGSQLQYLKCMILVLSILCGFCRTLCAYKIYYKLSRPVIQSIPIHYDIYGKQLHLWLSNSIVFMYPCVVSFDAHICIIGLAFDFPQSSQYFCICVLNFVHLKRNTTLFFLGYSRRKYILLTHVTQMHLNLNL